MLSMYDVWGLKTLYINMAYILQISIKNLSDL